MYKEKYYNIKEDEIEYELDKYLAYTCTGMNNKKATVIISHSDLDGVTSAINVAQAMKMIGNTDIIVYLEKNPTAEITTKIVDEFIKVNNNLKDGGIFNAYDEIHFVITDRMFVELKEYPENISFSWYDHHEGNVVSEEDIRKAGINLVGYYVQTDMHHCGATLTYENMYNLVENKDRYEDLTKEWSYNVNLWDTFKWKKDPDLDEDIRELGRKFGTIDKMMDSEKELFETLMEYVNDGVSLDSKEVRDWCTGLSIEYANILEVEFEKSLKFANIVDFMIADKRSIFLLIPATWKYSSNIKEKAVSKFAGIDCVITYHSLGGTVYTDYNYDIPSYEIAKYIGEMYGLNGGGQTNAAGFRCVLEDIYPNTFTEEDKNNIVKDRISLALKEFYYIKNKEGESDEE